MEIATQEETHRFLSGLWFRWGEALINSIATHYKLDYEQRESLLQILSKPNDWLLEVEGAI